MKRTASVFLTFFLAVSVMCGCAAEKSEVSGLGNGWEPAGTMELKYAEEFGVDYYEDGYKLITLGDGSRFLVVPEGKDVPKGISGDITPIYQPVENIYLAATSAMCLFDAMDRLDAIKLSGTKAEGWYIENARKAMENGEIIYAGKYSEPDYELILENNCPLAIESTMIGHASEVKEKLEKLGVPVLTDQSSREKHPLARGEWIKLYSALLNEEEKADELFSEQVSYLEALPENVDTGKTVAFFYINSSGYVVARKSGDYVSKMIELAGGKYVFDNLGDPEKDTSTVNVEMETFYETAKDADFVIYNSTIGGEINTMEEFLALNDLLKNFKAVEKGNVWCTSKNMFQETMQLGQMISDFNKIFTNDGAEPEGVEYLHKLK
ncbi:MAG: ABC transporter substrate-binding protein [Firmicutes bacterium]|nr:ABC transporter substrate-binding protein [Bacillota bacterium]